MVSREIEIDEDTDRRLAEIAAGRVVSWADLKARNRL